MDSKFVIVLSSITMVKVLRHLCLTVLIFELMESMFYFMRCVRD